MRDKKNKFFIKKRTGRKKKEREKKCIFLKEGKKYEAEENEKHQVFKIGIKWERESWPCSKRNEREYAFNERERDSERERREKQEREKERERE